MSNALPDDDPRLKSLCKFGEGGACCRWLARNGRGFFCAKLDPVWAPVIYRMFENREMRARGDNCPGLKDRIQIEFVRGRACPDCGSTLFHPGPRGGMAHNIKCADCGSTFWYSPPFKSERIEPVDGVYDLTVTRTLAEIERSPPGESNMRVTYDAQADAAYIYLVEIGKGEAKRTRAVAHEGIMLDFNASDALIGIEVLDATRRLPATVIARSQQISHDPMLPTSLKLGMTVEFDPKVFKPPYVPYYDAYRGHQFEVVAFHPIGHVEVVCVDDPSVRVAGHVHDDELVEVKSPPREST